MKQTQNLILTIIILITVVTVLVFVVVEIISENSTKISNPVVTRKTTILAVIITLEHIYVNPKPETLNP